MCERVEEVTLYRSEVPHASRRKQRAKGSGQEHHEGKTDHGCNCKVKTGVEVIPLHREQ